MSLILGIIFFVIIGIFIAALLGKVEGWLINYGAPPPRKPPKEKS